MKTKLLVSVGLIVLALTLIISPNVMAKKFKLPPFIPLTTYDLGSSAYRTAAMATEAITERTNQKFRLLPGSTDVARMSALRSGAVPLCTIGRRGHLC